MGSRKEKNRVIEEVVQEWRNRTPPGQFVAKHRTEAGECFWTDVGDELAKKRAAKSLAEWTPTPQRSTFPDAIETQIAEYKLPRARSKRVAPKEAPNSQGKPPVTVTVYRVLAILCIMPRCTDESLLFLPKLTKKCHQTTNDSI